MCARMEEDNNGNYIPNSFSFFDKKKNKKYVVDSSFVVSKRRLRYGVNSFYFGIYIPQV